MSDDLDRELTTLFARAAEPLPAEDFVATVSRRMERQRGWDRFALGVSIALAVCFSIGLALVLSVRAAPFVGGMTGALVRLTAAGTTDLGEWLLSPPGFTLSLVFGALLLIRQRRRAAAWPR
jgi:hypothetical protein